MELEQDVLDHLMIEVDCGSLLYGRALRGSERVDGRAGWRLSL